MKKKGYKMTMLERRVEEWFEWPMIFVTLALVVTMVLPLFFTLTPVWSKTLAIANLIIWLAFYVELGVKFSVASNFKEAFKRNWFLFVIALSPLFLSFRLVYISRLVGLTRFLGLQGTVKKFSDHMRAVVYNIEYVFLTLVVFVLIAAFVMWQVELRFDGALTNLPDALWWSVMTVTTMGHGDVVPLSVEGKIVGAAIAILGVVLFMALVAKLTSVFLCRGAKR